MDTQLQNNYPQNMDLALQLTMDCEFLGINDLYRLTKVDKFMNLLSNKYIKKYYEILEKCSSVELLKETIKYITLCDSSGNVHSIPRTIYIYDWCNLFNKKLNKDEMAIYYSCLVFKYHSFCETDEYSMFWRCILNEDGYIKSLPAESYYNILDTDIILRIDIHYSYDIYRNYPKKLNYWRTKIRFENKGKEIQQNFVNIKFLNKLILSKKFKNEVLKIVRKK